MDREAGRSRAVRRRSRARRRARASATRDGSRRGEAFRVVRNPYRPIEVLAPDRIEAIHQAALAVLRDVGLRVLCAEARGLYRAAGAEVDEDARSVRFDPALTESLAALAPPRIRLHARNPRHDVELGGDRVVFATVGGPPNVSDLDRGRRPGSLPALRELVRLAQSFEVVHVIGAPAEPVEVPPETRHLAILTGFGATR